MKKSILSLMLIFLLTQTKINDTTIVAVFCGGGDNVEDRFKAVAHSLGEELARHSFGLVNGGANNGLMKEVMNGYASIGNREFLFAVLCKSIAQKVPHPSILEKNIDWVDNLYVRLPRFRNLCDVVIILPGGFGTFHELADFLEHNKSPEHQKPILLVNVDGYWDNLIKQFELMKEKKFLKPTHLRLLHVVQTEGECIKWLQSFTQ